MQQTETENWLTNTRVCDFIRDGHYDRAKVLLPTLPSINSAGFRRSIAHVVADKRPWELGKISQKHLDFANYVSTYPGFDPTVQNSVGLSPAELALKNGNPEIAEIFALPDYYVRNAVPLRQLPRIIRASLQPHTRFVQHELERNDGLRSHPNTIDPRTGFTALHLACQFDDPDLATLLINLALKYRDVDFGVRSYRNQLAWQVAAESHFYDLAGIVKGATDQFGSTVHAMRMDLH